MNIFTYDEVVYMVGCLNGVRCQPSTLIANFLGGLEYQSVAGMDEEDFIRKLYSLNPEEILELYNKIYQFWDVESGKIFSTEERARKVGLID